LVEPGTEQLAAELAWAAHGAALEIEALKVRLSILQGVCDERDDVIAELKSHVAVVSRAAEERAAMIATLDEFVAREREQHLEMRAQLARELDAAFEEISDANRARSEDQHRFAVQQREQDATIEELRMQISALEGAALTREGFVAELLRTCDDRASQIEQLQAEKQAAAGQDAIIADLLRTCEERLVVIEQLSAELERTRV
jgi:chromosome segregation ATPase